MQRIFLYESLRTVERWRLILSTGAMKAVELLKGFMVDVHIDLISEGSACGVDLVIRRSNKF